MLRRHSGRDLEDDSDDNSRLLLQYKWLTRRPLKANKALCIGLCGIVQRRISRGIAALVRPYSLR